MTSMPRRQLEVGFGERRLDDGRRDTEPRRQLPEQGRLVWSAPVNGQPKTRCGLTPLASDITVVTRCRRRRRRPRSAGLARDSSWLRTGHGPSEDRGPVASTYVVFDMPAICPGAYHRHSVRVLIVEDEPYMAEAIRDGLRLEAIAADIAGDGNTALEVAHVSTPTTSPSSTATSPGLRATRSPGASSPRAAACRSSCSPRPTGSTTRPRGSGSAPTTTSRSPSSSESSCSASERSTDDAAHHRPPVRELAGLRLDPFRREVYRDGRYVALTRKQFAVLESTRRRRGRCRQRRGAAGTSVG